MKKFLTLFSMFFVSTSIFAENIISLSDKINGFFVPIVSVLAKLVFWDPIAALGFDVGADIPIVVIWLVFGALFFTFKMGFINIRGFKHAIELVQGKFDDAPFP